MAYKPNVNQISHSGPHNNNNKQLRVNRIPLLGISGLDVEMAQQS